MKALAMDLGGSGGRLFLGDFDGQKLAMQEIHRFANAPVEDAGHLSWNMPAIYAHLLQGMRKAAPMGFTSFGVDAFCNDYALLGINDEMLSRVVMYRDARTEGVLDKLDRVLDPRAVYQRTGCQRARFNTLTQLAAQMDCPGRAHLLNAQSLLFVPDLLNFWLCAEKAAEYTIASVSQVYDRLTNQWDAFTLDALEIPQNIFPAVVPCATRLGAAQKSILTETGAAAFTVCTVGQHDTASAVAGVPALEKNFAYISSGTWSLVGIETDGMITSDTAYCYNIANEGGVGNKNRFLINVMGLWLIQECVRQYMDMGEKLTYAELDAASLHTPPFRTLINPDDALFFQPGDMVGKIRRKCAQWGQPEPHTPAEMNRCIKESLALAYRAALEKIEEAAGISAECVYIIGGGCKSSLLNQFSASATGKRVLAGPEEAAAAGNLCAQLMAAGEIKGLAEARQVLRASMDLREFLPVDGSAWDEAFRRFKGICGGK